MSLALIPCTIKRAKEFVAAEHRHHPAPVGALFAVACEDGEEYPANLVGVAIIGRPVARGLDDGYTAEVIRLATDGSRNACSMLYGASWRAARALGYHRLITYTLASEPGTSLRAAGWREVGYVKGRSWSPSRPRQDKTPIEDKRRFEVAV